MSEKEFAHHQRQNLCISRAGIRGVHEGETHKYGIKSFQLCEVKTVYTQHWI